MASLNPTASAIDNLTAALKQQIIPNSEYLLQGSVMDSHAEVFLHRLRGLCDSSENNLEMFHDTEMCFSLRTTAGGQMGAPTPLILKVRNSVAPDQLDSPWHLRYIGQPELGDKNQPTVVRSCIDVACSSNIGEFLTELGFRLEYEYVLKGYIFRKGRMKATVSKLFRMNTSKGNDGMDTGAGTPFTGSYLVELSLLAPSGQDTAVGEDMRAFADQLKPLVNLEKIDYKRLATPANF